MSDQWVDQQGFLRNSSGRYRTGERSPASIATEADEKAFNFAKGYYFISPPQDAWAIACRPSLAALLVNEGVCVGIELHHARLLRNQLNTAIKSYEKLRQEMASSPEETNKKLCAAAGITLGTYTTTAVDATMGVIAEAVNPPHQEHP